MQRTNSKTSGATRSASPPSESPVEQRRGRFKRKCHCGAVFYSTMPTAKYCSKLCMDVARLDRVKRENVLQRRVSCALCDKPFVGNRKDAKYCCNAHRQAAYRALYGVRTKTRSKPTDQRSRPRPLRHRA